MTDRWGDPIARAAERRSYADVAPIADGDDHYCGACHAALDEDPRDASGVACAECGAVQSIPY